MNIVFICGSLEPGHDGVGDYTRRLAGELIRQRQNVCLISINEKNLDSLVLEEAQVSEGTAIPVFRLSDKQNYKTRMIYAEKWLAVYKPAWISLQYVPFSFHSIGVHFGLSKLLSRFGKDFKWHIMFHELWLGMDKESSKKHYWLGKFHRLLIQSLIIQLKPSVIHTQTHLYQQKIISLGFNAKYLPLFSNIPLVKPTLQTGNKREDVNSKKSLVFVLFGAIQHSAPFVQFTDELALFQRTNNIKTKLVFIGRTGTEQDLWVSEGNSKGITIQLMGEQSPEVVSEILHGATIGVSTTPIQLAEKSGCVAAMREHHLPVICVSRSWRARGIKNLALPPDIIEYKIGGLTECLTKAGTTKNKVNRISEVSLCLIEDLLSNK